jgi:hypothetical protein
MKITKEFLQNKHVDKKDIEYFEESGLIGLCADEFIEKLVLNDKVDIIARLNFFVFNDYYTLKYAAYAAEQVLPIFENFCHGDKRPRNAVKAVKDYIKRPSKENADTAIDTANRAFTASTEAFKIADNTADIHKRNVFLAAGHTASAAGFAAFNVNKM